MKKKILAALLLAAALLLPGCGREKQTEFQVGDRVDTYWFQFTVDQVKTTDRWMDYQPQERTGCLVFEVPQGVTQAKLVFQELFNEGDSDSVYTEGDTYTVDVDLPA